MLFYVREGARVWAHGNYFFDMHLSYLDQYPVFSHLEFPQGLP